MYSFGKAGGGRVKVNWFLKRTSRALSQPSKVYPEVPPTPAAGKYWGIGINDKPSPLYLELVR